MPEMNLRPLDVGDDEIVYTDDTALWEIPFSLVHLEGQARGGRYDLYVLNDHCDDNSVVITLANFGRAIKLKMSHYSVSWDYVGDKLDLRKVDAQIVAHMINRAFVSLDLIPGRKLL